MRVTDLEEAAWGLLVNISVGDGEWKSQTPEWQEAAARWREQYHAKLAESEDDRLSKLEQAMVSLAVSVAGLQTLALQGNTGGALTQWELARQYEPDREIEMLDGSKIQVKDVPLGEDGMPEEEWAMEHCPCETHEEKRKAAAAAEAARTGQYL